MFISGVVRMIVANDYASAWPDLHPVHRRFVGRDDYVSCEMRSAIAGTLRSVEVLRVYDEPVLLGDGRQAVASKAVALLLTLKDDQLEHPVEVTHTGHAVAVDGRWTWVLPSERAIEYRAGRCPA